MMTEEEIESALKEKGLTAPRLTPDIIDKQIVKEQFHRFTDSTVIICCLTLRNGYKAVGHSACVSPANFDPEIGRNIARDRARDQVWQLEGYRLKDRIHKAASAGIP